MYTSKMRRQVFSIQTRLFFVCIFMRLNLTNFVQVKASTFFLFIEIKWQVLSELDIYAVVGANKPLRLIDSRVYVKDDGVIVIRFESITGSPVVSGICIRRATKASGTVVLVTVLE